MTGDHSTLPILSLWQCFLACCSAWTLMWSMSLYLTCCCGVSWQPGTISCHSANVCCLSWCFWHCFLIPYYIVFECVGPVFLTVCHDIAVGADGPFLGSILGLGSKVPCDPCHRCPHWLGLLRIQENPTVGTHKGYPPVISLNYMLPLVDHGLLFLVHIILNWTKTSSMWSGLYQRSNRPQ